MSETAKMGRPRESAELLEHKLSVRLSHREMSELKRLAQSKEVTAGRWVRETIRRELKNV